MTLFCSSLNVVVAAGQIGEPWALVLAEAGGGAMTAIGFFESRREAEAVARSVFDDLSADIEEAGGPVPDATLTEGFYVEEGLIDLIFAAELIKACVFDLSLGLPADEVLRDTSELWVGPKHRAAPAAGGGAGTIAKGSPKIAKVERIAEVAKHAPMIRSSATVRGVKSAFQYRSSAKVIPPKGSRMSAGFRADSSRGR